MNIYKLDIKQILLIHEFLLPFLYSDIISLIFEYCFDYFSYDDKYSYYELSFISKNLSEHCYYSQLLSDFNRFNSLLDRKIKVCTICYLMNLDLRSSKHKFKSYSQVEDISSNTHIFDTADEFKKHYFGLEHQYYLNKYMHNVYGFSIDHFDENKEKYENVKIMKINDENKNNLILDIIYNHSKIRKKNNYRYLLNFMELKSFEKKYLDL